MGEVHGPSVWGSSGTQTSALGLNPEPKQGPVVSFAHGGLDSAPGMAMAGHRGWSGFPAAAGPASSRAAEESLVPSSMSWQQETRLRASHVI